MENIEVRKTVYNKETFDKVVDRDFKTFVPPAVEQDTDTVEEFFRLYNKLYYTIPLEGENNSHQYLLHKSSELVDFEKTTEDIQPLLDEIGQLRAQLLSANEQIFELQSQLTDG